MVLIDKYNYKYLKVLFLTLFYSVFTITKYMYLWTRGYLIFVLK